jgi:hypothetical protein
LDPEEFIPSIAYQVVPNDKGRPESRGDIDGEPVTEITEPLAGIWLRFKACF